MDVIPGEAALPASLVFVVGVDDDIAGSAPFLRPPPLRALCAFDGDIFFDDDDAVCTSDFMASAPTPFTAPVSASETAGAGGGGGGGGEQAALIPGGEEELGGEDRMPGGEEEDEAEEEEGMALRGCGC